MLRAHETALTLDELRIVEARSGSLKKVMKNLDNLFGVPPEVTGRLQDRILRQVRQIVRDSVEMAFKEGFRRGAEAGVQADSPSDPDWEYVAVEPLREAYSVSIAGVGAIDCPVCRMLIEGIEGEAE